MKKTALLSLAALTIVSAAHAQTLSVGFEPNKTRYARGESFNVRVTFKNAAGTPCAYTWIQIGDTWDRLPFWNWNWYCTDGRGQVVLPYTVSRDPNKDNIHIGACFPAWGTFNAKRIPIGR